MGVEEIPQDFVSSPSPQHSPPKVILDGWQLKVPHDPKYPTLSYKIKPTQDF